MGLAGPACSHWDPLAWIVGEEHRRLPGTFWGPLGKVGPFGPSEAWQVNIGGLSERVENHRTGRHFYRPRLSWTRVSIPNGVWRIEMNGLLYES
jgi:hypothetical protein